MAVPKRKISKSRSRSRRAQWNMKAPQLGKCQNCGSRIPTHVVCPQCGHYMGRPMVAVED
jgi:large subunit ribosomal protein L32